MHSILCQRCSTQYLCTKFLFVTIGLLLSVTFASPFAQANPSPTQQLERLKYQPALKKLGSTLFTMTQDARYRPASQRQSATLNAATQMLARTESDAVWVDVYTDGAATRLAEQLKSLGLESYATHRRGLSVRVPWHALSQLAAHPGVRFLRPVATISDGLARSQGDRALGTDEARRDLDVDGTGIRVGVLSDSFDCRTTPLGSPQFTTASEDILNGDLPDDVIVLADIADDTCLDEGRAMLQVIHDVAPGASGAFHTAQNGQADFADGILELALGAGSDIIVADLLYFSEPMFADGVIAQAADQVRSWGIPYYAAAGNRARQGYTSEFRSSGEPGIFGERHDFDPGPETDTRQSVTIGPDSFVVFSFQWDEPYFSVSGAPGAASDLDFLFLFEDGTTVPFCSIGTDACQFPGIDVNIGGDPIEIAALQNKSNNELTVDIVVELFSGSAPGRMKYVYFKPGSTFSLNEFDTQSATLYGHANAAGAEAVGAAIFTQTAAFPQPDPLGFVDVPCAPACVNSFSSAGGTPILRDPGGVPLTVPDVRPKPGIVGPDGGNTSFFYEDSIRDTDTLPNFFGTSASAAHVAAAAALVFDFTRSSFVQTSRRGTRWYVCLQDDTPGQPGGITQRLLPSEAQALMRSNAATLRQCGAFSADNVIALLRSTAHDMQLRAAPSADGGTAFTVPDPEGFDFDTGFGFVNIPGALDVLSNGDDNDDDGDDDDDGGNRSRRDDDDDHDHGDDDTSRREDDDD